MINSQAGWVWQMRDHSHGSLQLYCLKCPSTFYSVPDHRILFISLKTKKNECIKYCQNRLPLAEWQLDLGTPIRGKASRPCPLLLRGLQSEPGGVEQCTTADDHWRKESADQVITQFSGLEATRCGYSSIGEYASLFFFNSAFLL